MKEANAFLEPGMLVRNPSAPEWGIGQVQSVAQHRVTVNFREHGKVVIDGMQVALELVFEAR